MSNKKKKDYFYWIKKSSVACDNKDYEKSYNAISKALQIEENCPVAWWYLAVTLEGLGEFEDAITVWEEIVSYENIKTNFLEEPCWGSEEFKTGLILDSIYRIGNASIAIDEVEKAKRYLKLFLEKKKLLDDDDNSVSIYKIEDVVRQYNLISKK